MDQPTFPIALFDAPAIQRVAGMYAALPRSQQRIADYVLRHAFDVATASIEELAQAAEVSIATANRFARALGYSSYPDFRADLLQVFKTALEPVEKLRDIKPGTRLHDTLLAVIAQSVDNLQATRSLSNADAHEHFVLALRQSERVYIVGFGSSAFLASSAAYHLGLYCPNVHSIGGEGGAEQAVRRMNQLTAQDLVFGISFPRYSADTVRLLHFAQQRGAVVAALTDAPTSPLVQLAQHVLYAKANSALLSSSNVAALTVLEALGAMLAQGQSNALAQARDLAEQLMPYFYFGRADAQRITPAASSKRKQ